MASFFEIIDLVVVSIIINAALGSVHSVFTKINISPSTEGININTELLNTIDRGVDMALDNCQEIFQWDRWNCPDSAFSRLNKQPTTREVAFSGAIIAAAVVHAIAMNCSKGQLKGCGCDPTLSTYPEKRIITQLNHRRLNRKSPTKKKEVDWAWGGCSHDVDYGDKVAEQLLANAAGSTQDPRASAHIHNIIAGQKAVRETMVKRCRCHGVSGSCSMQTCWMQLAPFSDITKMLKKRYDKAVKINLDNRRGELAVGSGRAFPLKRLPRSMVHNLVFIDESPNYCVAGATSGWPGTKGRICSKFKPENATLSEKRSCKNLCRACGHRVLKHQREISWRCNCTFKWCCEVECSTCTKTIDEYFCD